MPIKSAAVNSNNGLSYKQLIDLFNGQFLSVLNTRLEAGYDEPVYIPATKKTPARVCFRHDYPSSALHEVAHWCIAGSSRRQQLDYGYWYEPDGRCQDKQIEFEQVEVKPQALEWIFSLAAGIRFCISVDNLDGDVGESSESSAEANIESSKPFADSVISQAQKFITQDSLMPQRAKIFYLLLLEQGFGKVPEPKHFSLEYL